MELRPGHPELLRFGVFEIDLERGELRKAGMKQKLPGQAFQVLRALVERFGEIVTREELRDLLWPDNTVVDYDLGLKKAVNRVREVLGDSAESPRFIETVPRRGYRFIAPIQAVEAAPASPRVRQARWKLAVSLALGVAAGLSFILNAGRLRTRIFANARVSEIRSIAVLPLQNLSNDPSQDYFSEGITDALTTDLAQIGSLRVISRTSAMQFKGAKETLPQIGRDLKVDAIVEGTVSRAENRVRITAQLIEASTDHHLWARSYEREMKDVLALQDDIARDIANEIRTKLTPEERARLDYARPVVPEAHDAYLRGRYLWNKRTEAELHKAKEYFEQAIAKDPGFAPAYSGLSDTYFYLSYEWGHIPPVKGMPLAKAAALKAIKLDDSSAEGHASYGVVKFLYEWDVPAAAQEYKRAVDLNPNYEFGHHGYAVVLAAQGRTEEAIAEARKAVAADPLSIPANNMLGTILQAVNHCDDALAVDKNTLELDPNPTHLAMVHGRMAACYRAKGMGQQSLEEEVIARTNQGVSPEEIQDLRKTYARFGRKIVLQKDLHSALARWDKDHWHLDAYSIAMLYAELGDLNKAFAWIDKCIELRSSELMWIYVGDNPLRNDPRFAEVQRKMGVHY